MDQVLNLAQLATYLRRDARELERLADRGKIPGRKVRGQWLFHQREIDDWLDRSIGELSPLHLAGIESGVGSAGFREPWISSLLSEALVAFPLVARTRSASLRSLVGLAARAGRVDDPAALLAAVWEREKAGSTALETGVAVPHPRWPLPLAVRTPLVVFGRTGNGIPFGAPGGGLTNVFFLFCGTDPALHLQLLARLVRLLRWPGVRDALRVAESSTGILDVIASAERLLLDQPHAAG
jgi:PTS system nitrogen regulatory IIA component